MCGNMRFVADGANAAEGTTVLTVFLVAGPGAATTLQWMVGEDHDRFVRTGHVRSDAAQLGAREVEDRAHGRAPGTAASRKLTLIADARVNIVAATI